MIDHFKPCMTDIYLHIDARVADYIRTHPYLTAPPFNLSSHQVLRIERGHAVLLGSMDIDDYQAVAFLPSFTDKGGADIKT